MKTKPWIIAGIALVALFLLYVLLGGFSPGAAVEAAKVRRGAIREFVDEQAKTRLPQTYCITMPQDGRIEAVDWPEGTRVAKDQVVARIVPTDLDLAVREAEAGVARLEASIRENADVRVEETGYEQAVQYVKSMVASVQAAAERVTAGKAKLDFADRDLARVKRLAATGARTQDDLERTELAQVESDVAYKQDRLGHAAMVAMAAATDLMPTMVRQYIDRKELSGDVLKKQKLEAEVRLEQARRNQQRGTMRSPVDGVVLARLVTNERFLTAGTPLLEIGRLEELEVESDILTLDAAEVKEGDPVEIYGPAIGRKPARGTVARVYPAGFTKLSSLGVEQQRVKVIIRFAEGELERLAGNRLGVGYRVRVRIITADKPQTLIVPRSALFRAADNSWRVFAIRNGQARLQSVEVGMMNDEQAEIEKGLTEGESVVLAPESTLIDGTKVSVVEKPPL